jgi:hypothetical protein
LAEGQAVSRRAYKVDQQKVRDATRRDRAAEREHAADLGWYTFNEFRMVPIDDIEHRDAWNPGRLPPIREAFDRGIPLPPVRLDQLPSGTYSIGDGIHRYTVSRERGMTHVPAIVAVVVDAPELLTGFPASAELPVRTFVKLADGRWGALARHLRETTYRGARRHVYEVVGVERGADEADYLGDFGDWDFTIARPPETIVDLIEGWWGW